MTNKLHNGIVIMSIIYEVNPQKPSVDFFFLHLLCKNNPKTE